VSAEQDPSCIWPSGGGQTGALIREKDWRTTPLRAPRTWPQSLRSATDLVLHSPTAMALAWGPEGTLLGNDACAALLGPPRGWLGERLAAICPDLAGGDTDLLGAALAGRSRSLRDGRVTVMRDGQPVPAALDLDGSPVVDETGAPAGLFVVLRAGAEDQAKALQQERDLSIEMRRQARNTLGVIRAVIRRSLQASQTLEDLALHLDGRVAAVGRALSTASNPAHGVDLELLLGEELLAQQAREGEQVSLAGPEVRLPVRVSERLGLAIHELTTNAIKHGALGRPTGRIAIRWEIVPGPDARRLTLVWKETGVAGRGEAPRHRGFGAELLHRMLPYELRAVVTWVPEPDGVRCTITLPLD
jgi:two-component sensor histidine kinase